MVFVSQKQESSPLSFFNHQNSKHMKIKSWTRIQLMSLVTNIIADKLHSCRACFLLYLRLLFNHFVSYFHQLFLATLPKLMMIAVVSSAIIAVVSSAVIVDVSSPMVAVSVIAAVANNLLVMTAAVV